jgi:hypothetical protein
VYLGLTFDKTINTYRAYSCGERFEKTDASFGGNQKYVWFGSPTGGQKPDAGLLYTGVTDEFKTFDYFDKRYEYFLSLTSPSIPKRFHYIPPRDLSRFKDTGLVLAINANSLQGKDVIDLSGNGNTITRGIGFNKVSNYIHVYTSSISPYTFCPFKDGQINLGTVHTLMFRVYLNGDNRNYIIGENNPQNYIFFRSDDSNLWYRANNGTNFVDFRILDFFDNVNERADKDVWFDIVLRRNNLIMDIFVNGILTDTIDNTGENNVDFLVDGLITFNGNSPGYANYFFRDFRIYTTLKSNQEILDYHNQFARQVNIKEDFSDYPVGETRIKNSIPGTGSYEVQELDNTQSQLPVGKKVLKCLSDGTYVISSEQAYGEWEFRGVQRIPGSQLRIRFIGINDGQYYSIFWNGVQYIQIDRGGNILGRNFTLQDYDERYDFLIQRLSSKGKFPLIGDGIEYNVGTFAVFYRETTPNNSNPYQLIPVSSGSNPVTDNTYTTSKYMVLDIDADDSISEIITREGVQQSVTLPATVFGPIEESTWYDALVWDDAEVWID